MLGTRPTFLSFAEMFFPEMDLGIARIVSLCFGSGFGWSGRYVKCGSSWRRAAADWEK